MTNMHPYAKAMRETLGPAYLSFMEQWDEGFSFYAETEHRANHPATLAERHAVIVQGHAELAALNAKVTMFMEMGKALQEQGVVSPPQVLLEVHDLVGWDRFKVENNLS